MWDADYVGTVQRLLMRKNVVSEHVAANGQNCKEGKTGQVLKESLDENKRVVVLLEAHRYVEMVQCQTECKSTYQRQIKETWVYHL